MLRTTFALVALCLGLSLVAAQQPAPAPAVTMGDIKKAWQERQDKVKTLKMSWATELVRPKGSIIGVDRSNEFIHAPRDLTLKGETTLVVEGNKYALHDKRQAWSPVSAGIEDSEFRTVFDGHRRIDLTKPGSHFGTAHIIEPAKAADNNFKTVSLYPVWWTFRGASDLETDQLLDRLELSDRITTLNGIRCRELTQLDRSSRSMTKIYVDEQRGFLPIRYDVVHDNMVVVLLTISHISDPACGWRPSSWYSVLNTNKGKLRESLKCRVSSCNVNSTLSDADLTANLESGTLVVDHTDSATKMSVVRPDGTDGVQLPNSANLTRDDLIRANESPPFYQSRILLVSVMAACGAFLAGSMLWKMRQRRLKAAK